MPARSIERPDFKEPHSRADVEAWLRFLCLNSACRGLGGYELADSGLVLLRGLSGLLPEHAAEAIRTWLRGAYDAGLDCGTGGTSDKAKLRLLGLTPATYAQARAFRRREAAEAVAIALDTFQRRTERDLLIDVAADLWREFGELSAS